MVEFSLDIITVTQFLITSILPLAVGLVTTRVTHGGVKATLLALFTLVTSLGTEAVRAWQEEQTYDLGAGLFLALPAFVTAIGLYYGLYKPTGISQKAQDVGTSKDAHEVDAAGA
jgi:hypothetical protein